MAARQSGCRLANGLRRNHPVRIRRERNQSREEYSREAQGVQLLAEAVEERRGDWHLDVSESGQGSAASGRADCGECGMKGRSVTARLDQFWTSTRSGTVMAAAWVPRPLKVVFVSP